MATTKIIIISPAWIGDAIMAESLYQQIKIQYKAHITVLAPKSIADLHLHMKTVDKVISHELPRKKLSLKQRYQLAQQIKKYQFDTAFILPNSWKSALIPWFAKIPSRIGWLGEARYGLLTQHQKLNKQQYPMMIARYLALLDKTLSQASYTTPQLQPKAFETLPTLKQKQKLIALCPGAAYGSSKRWPALFFAAVAEFALKQGYAVCLLGGDKDADTCHQINTITHNNCIDLAGKTSLSEMINIINQAHQIISNDTGLMHVAAALNKSLITVFGSSSPGFTPPLQGDAIILSEDNLSCKPCFQRTCPLGDLKCLNDITPQHVIKYLV